MAEALGEGGERRRGCRTIHGVWLVVALKLVLAGWDSKWCRSTSGGTILWLIAGEYRHHTDVLYLVWFGMDRACLGGVYALL